MSPLAIISALFCLQMLSPLSPGCHSVNNFQSTYEVSCNISDVCHCCQTPPFPQRPIPSGLLYLWSTVSSSFAFSHSFPQPMIGSHFTFLLSPWRLMILSWSAFLCNKTGSIAASMYLQLLSNLPSWPVPLIHGQLILHSLTTIGLHYSSLPYLDQFMICLLIFSLYSLFVQFSYHCDHL